MSEVKHEKKVERRSCDVAFDEYTYELSREQVEDILRNVLKFRERFGHLSDEIPEDAKIVFEYDPVDAEDVTGVKFVWRRNEEIK